MLLLPGFIRKVPRASVAGIVSLLSEDFINLVLPQSSSLHLLPGISYNPGYRILLIVLL